MKMVSATKRKSVRRGGIVIAAVLGLSMGQGPAQADHTVESGAGFGIGGPVSTVGADNPSGHPLCARVTSHIENSINDASSTYTATDHSTGVKRTYTGPSTITVNFGDANLLGGEDLYVTIHGDFRDPLCTIPSLAPISVTISGTNTAGDTVSCATLVSGTHQRVNTHVVRQFVAPCTVDLIAPGVGPVTSDGNTTHLINAEVMPCGPCPPLYSYQGTYTET